jgi:hypothetical protein
MTREQSAPTVAEPYLIVSDKHRESGANCDHARGMAYLLAECSDLFRLSGSNQQLQRARMGLLGTTF